MRPAKRLGQRLASLDAMLCLQASMTGWATLPQRARPALHKPAQLSQGALLSWADQQASQQG